jgi:hypothetical protein
MKEKSKPVDKKKSAASGTGTSGRKVAGKKPVAAKTSPKVAAKSGQGLRNGAQTIVDFLESSGVEVVFGYPGGAVIP